MYESAFLLEGSTRNMHEYNLVFVLFYFTFSFQGSFFFFFCNVMRPPERTIRMILFDVIRTRFFVVLLRNVCIVHCIGMYPLSFFIFLNNTYVLVFMEA